MQPQGYWNLNNWLLYDLQDVGTYRDLATRTSESVLAMQRKDGYWEYPNREWRGRIATVEGCFGALGLLESYARTGEERFLAGAVRWYRFMTTAIGFRRQPGATGLAIHYFAHGSGVGGGVPNNSTLALWMLARLSEFAESPSLPAEAGSMLAWLESVQRTDGELPYSVESKDRPGKPHFLCFQYNAFEFMDLVQFYRITGDPRARSIMERLAQYLTSGLEGGIARYECSQQYPEVMYYTSAVAQALSQATDLGIVDERAAVDVAYRRMLRLQQPDGSLPFHSRRNYRFLTDRRSYPRYLSMILHHLLLEARRHRGRA